ncbi:MAG: hypothetical protein AAFO98_15545, partial [Pseudomonadota bacterium]
IYTPLIGERSQNFHICLGAFCFVWDLVAWLGRAIHDLDSAAWIAGTRPAMTGGWVSNGG